MGRFSVRPYVHTSVRTYVPPSRAQEPAMPQSQPARPQSQPARPQEALRPAWLALRPDWLDLRPAWLALRPWRGGTDGRTDGRTDVRTDGRMENIPILQDSIPYRAQLQSKNCIERGKGTADHMPLGDWFFMRTRFMRTSG